MRTSLRGSSSIAALMVLAGCKPAALHGTVYEPPEPAPAMQLRGAHGDFSLAAERGKVVLIYFGYTHCPDLCPTTLSDWRRIRDSLGADASRVTFVFVSVDPARDDPATLDHYVHDFDPGFIGVTSDSARLASIESAFHVTSSRETSSSAAGYSVIHPSQTFVVDRRGQLRELYSFGLPPADVVADIRELIHGN